MTFGPISIKYQINLRLLHLISPPTKQSQSFHLSTVHVLEYNVNLLFKTEQSPFKHTLTHLPLPSPYMYMYRPFPKFTPPASHARTQSHMHAPTLIFTRPPPTLTHPHMHTPTLTSTHSLSHIPTYPPSTCTHQCFNL